MREPRIGYIYRHPDANIATLRRVLEGCTIGWAWDARTLVQGMAQVHASLKICTEGRACGATREVRWRRSGEQVDLLLLTLTEEPPAEFVPLLPAPDTPWRTDEVDYRWQVAPIPNGANDTIYSAIHFIAPDGSIQFVALTDRRKGEPHAG